MDETIGNYFSTDIHPDYIISILEKYYNKGIVPDETLIIFDEIQMCERALTSLKYFAEEAPEYHVIAAGSLLGVALKHEKYSFPVGKVQMLTMYPMDFEEVLWAKGKTLLADTIKAHFDSSQPVEEGLHQEAVQEFYHYCIVGGMPAAVNAELIPNSPLKQDEVRQMLLNSYIAKCSQGFFPLAAFQDLSAFKLYYSDMGIMSARTGLSMEVLQGKETEHFRGIMMENYVSIALRTNGYDLCYWESDNTSEVDFLIQKDGHVIPVECKAGDHVKAKSLKVYMEKYNPEYAIRISTRNFGMANGIKSVPLYAVFCI